MSTLHLTAKGTRSINEDYVTFAQKEGNFLAVVADGLGGHDKGEVASEHVGTYIRDNYCFDEASDTALRKAVHEAQNSLLLLQEKEKQPYAMKTTVVALPIKGNKARFAHVGDSRGYMFGKRKKYIRTIDHSVPQMLVLTGEIKEKQIRYHQERNSLLRVLGSPWEKDLVEVSEELDINGVKAFLLCTDGFWELIEEKQMIKCLKKSKTPGDWLKQMVKIVKENGHGREMDNCSACAVFITEE